MGFLNHMSYITFAYTAGINRSRSERRSKMCIRDSCKDLLQYKIDPDKCRGCTLCARTCPNGAVVGTLREVHMIDQEKCVKCGACMEKCRFGAIYKE